MRTNSAAAQQLVEEQGHTGMLLSRLRPKVAFSNRVSCKKTPLTSSLSPGMPCSTTQPVVLSTSSMLTAAPHFALISSPALSLALKSEVQRRRGLLRHSSHLSSAQPDALQEGGEGMQPRGMKGCVLLKRYGSACYRHTGSYHVCLRLTI